MRTLPHQPAAGAPRAQPGPAPAAAATPARQHRAGWDGQAVLATPEAAQVVFSAWNGDPAIVVPSPPGAGKTRLVTLLAAYLADRAGLHIGIAAQTREQAVEIARRAGRVTARTRLLWPAKAPRPASGATPVASGQAGFPSDAGGILIATTKRWLYGDLRAMRCDVMIVDEAWQATYGDLGALGAFARQIVCVGDPGQIEPVVTGATTRWARSPHGPQVPAPAALTARYGDAVTEVALRHTWRLGPATAGIIQPVFYPALAFTSRRPPEHVASPGGVLPEVTAQTVTLTAGPGDPVLAEACADRARALLAGHYLVTTDQTAPLAGDQIAVVTAHVAQASAVRALLADEPDVLVGTANQLQGLERAAVVALHPLAGYRDPGGGFGADMGRACVMLSRHRAHLTVITDTITPGVLAADDSPAARIHTALLRRLGVR
jgi:hypothetical protein